MTTFLATIHDSQLTFEPYNKARWHDFLKRSEGKTVRIELAKKKRSLNQNSLYWKWLEIISAETGNSLDTCHRYFKGTYGKRETVKFGTKEISMPKSTSQYSTGEMVELMMNVEAEAGQLGISLPHPEDYAPELRQPVWKRK